MKEAIVLGIMSGTSFDGIDLALCRFRQDEKKWKFRIVLADTFPYPEKLKQLILSAHTMSPENFLKLHNSYGRFLGLCCNLFLDKQKHRPELIASHGHTIFHQPDHRFTFQLGSGAEIAAITGTTTVCDFRSLDVALNGQGAPLVPIGDELLFGSYSHCINIGGIANISARKKSRRVAWDICPANMALNFLAGMEGRSYDENGQMARAGRMLSGLNDALNELSYYSQKPPKSLGREWFEKEFLPLILNYRGSVQDKLHTVTWHISHQIVSSVTGSGKQSVLCTGGGAKNGFLVSCLKEKLGESLVIPSEKIVDYKEALVFALLGLLRSRGRVNSLGSVTGASSDSSSGVIYKM